MNDPEPARGQIWRGNNSRLGFGLFEEAIVTDVDDRRILLRWRSGGEHHTEREMLGPRHLWSYVGTEWSVADGARQGRPHDERPDRGGLPT